MVPRMSTMLEQAIKLPPIERGKCVSLIIREEQNDKS